MATPELSLAELHDRIRRDTPDPHPIRALVDNYRWVHTIIGVFGNLAFLLGSVCFLWESAKSIGVWLFIVGSAGMLIGSIGSALVDFETDD